MEGEPHVASHILKDGKRLRYDFIFVKDRRFDLRGCQYYYEEALAATSDHAYIVAYSDMELIASKETGAYKFMSSVDKDYKVEDFLPYCRHYDPEQPQDKQGLHAFLCGEMDADYDVG